MPGKRSELDLVACTCVTNTYVTLNGEKARGGARSSTVCAIDCKVMDLEDGEDLSDH